MPHYQRPCSFISIGPAIDPNNDNDDDPFHMTDFILWNVIGFAIDDDLPQQLALVSKRWNGLVGPPVQLRMMQLLELFANERQPIPRDEGLSLLKEALSMMCNRSSNIYWSSIKEQKEPATLGPAPSEEDKFEIQPWPELPPSFQALVSSFCFVLSSQSPSPREVFEFVCEFLDELARETALSMWQSSFSATQKPLTWDEAMPKLRVLAQTRYEFQSTVSLVINISSFLGRPSAQNHYDFLQPLATVACKSLRTHLTNLQPSLAPFLQISPTTFYNEQSVMLRLASEICSSILSLPSSPANLSETSQAHLSAFMSRDESAEFTRALPHVAYQLDSMEKKVTAIETRRLLYSMDCVDSRPPLLWAIPDGAPSLIPTDMFEICAFLAPLSLKGGETIRIRMKNEILENIKRFYQIEGGCPVIEQLPLACFDLQGLVPAPYVEYHQSLDHNDIMDLIHGADVFGLVDLQDFAAVCMALFLKGKSADELRAAFGD